MRWDHLLSDAVIIIAISSPAIASGHHISCQLSGIVQLQSDKQEVTRTLNFYLDDVGEKLVPENNGPFALTARTTLYADTEITAEISDCGLSGGDLFLFGALMNPPALLQINRLTGSAAIVAKLLPAGSDIEMGNCREIAPPPTKF